MSVFAPPLGDPRRDIAEKRLAKLASTNAKPWNGSLSDEQFQWLELTLDQAMKNKESVIINCHYPVYPVDMHNLWDSDKIVELITSYPNVLAYFCGHNHAGNYGQKGHVYFVNFKGMVDTPQDSLYSIAQLFNDKIKIHGYSTEKKMITKKISVGIIGATGFAGQQLVWLLHQHPNVKIEFVALHSHSTKHFSEIYQNYDSFFEKRLIHLEEVGERLSTIDLMFLALPHGLSEPLTQKARDANVRVIDLGADFRFDNETVFEKWYKTKHENPELNKEAVYGMPELYTEEIKTANIVACPGCYPTAAILGVAPLLKTGFVKPSIIIDTKSGVSSTGRSESLELLFAELNENLKAYNLFTHRHTPEMAQEMGKLADQEMDIVFTPHLLPINRGVLATIYMDLTEPMTEKEVYAQYNAFYAQEHFVRIIKNIPQLSHVKNSNICEIGIRVDEERQKVIIISAIDNLIKGASGQAIQCMNLMFGIDESKGIQRLVMYI